MCFRAGEQRGSTTANAPGGAILTEPVVRADGGVAANPFARKLVVPLSSQQLEVEGLLKLARGISVEPNPQGDLAVGRHDPAERQQAAREQIKNPRKRVSQPNRNHVASFPPAVSPEPLLPFLLQRCLVVDL